MYEIFCNRVSDLIIKHLRATRLLDYKKLTFQSDFFTFSKRHFSSITLFQRQKSVIE